MATDQVRTKTGRNEAFVAKQLARAEQRIRRFDVAAGGLCLLAVTLFWFVAAAILHRILGLPDWLRMLGLAGYALTAGFTLYWAVLRPWRRPLNPLYTAFVVERLLPDAHNSVASFLDLRQQQLPGTLRQALSLRAARDLTDTVPEKAVSPRPVITVGAVAGGAVVVVLASILVLGIGPFLAVLWPFSSAAVVPPFRLALVSPAGGDATIPAGRALTVVVVAENVSEAHEKDPPRLLFRYQADSPDLERPLRPQEDGRHWSVTLPTNDVRAGFRYRVRGYGAETPTHHITVRANPALVAVRATYHHRAYVGRPDRTSNERNLQAICGTEVTLRARADRPVKAAFLDLQRDNGGSETIAAQKVAEDPQAFDVKFVVDRSGSYRLRFKAESDETYADAAAFLVTALADRAPTVELTEPKSEESSLSADGLLRVAGKVRDDIGVAGVTLRLRVVKGAMLPDRPVRPATLALAGGGNVQGVDFLDPVDLGKLCAAKPGVIGANMELEGWLEARDGCDFSSPGDVAVPHIVESRHFRVHLLPPDPAMARQQDQEKRQAQADKKQNDRQQEDQRRSEEQDRQKEGQQPDAGSSGDRNQQKPGGQSNQDKKDSETANQAQRALDQLGQGKQDQGEGKNDQEGEGKGNPQPGEKKDGPDGKQNPQPDGQHGDVKGQGGADGGQPGAGKDAGKDGADGKQGAGKDEGMSGKNEPGEGRGQGQDGNGNGQSKPDASGAPDPAIVKGDASEGPGQPGAGKPASGTGPASAAEVKPSGPPGEAPPGQARGADDPGTRGTARGDGGAPPNSEGANKSAAGAQGAKAEAKPAPGPEGRDQTAQSKPEKPRADISPEDVKRRAQDMQDPDPRKQAEALRDLQQAAANAKDEEARQEARDALAREGLAPPADKPAHGKDRPPDAANPAHEAESQVKDKGQSPTTAAADGKGGASPNQGASKGNGGAGMGGSESAKAKDGSSETPGSQQRYDPRSPQQARLQRATVLQLLSAKDLLTRAQLQKAGFKDDAAYRRFLADCEALLRRPRPPRTLGQEEVPSPRSGTNLPSLAGKTSEGATGSDLRIGEQGQPPPGYRRAYDELTRKLRQLP